MYHQAPKEEAMCFVTPLAALSRLLYQFDHDFEDKPKVRIESIGNSIFFQQLKYYNRNRFRDQTRESAVYILLCISSSAIFITMV